MVTFIIYSTNEWKMSKKMHMFGVLEQPKWHDLGSLRMIQPTTHLGRAYVAPYMIYVILKATRIDHVKHSHEVLVNHALEIKCLQP